jgi:cystathionine beta-lyase/cystathionine gamma-synthase
MPQKDDSINTRLVHADRELNQSSAVAPPIYQTSTFRADSAADFDVRASRARHPEYYTRFGNPNRSQIERVLADLEGAEAALVTASGMSAIATAVLAIASQGSHIVAQENHYGGTSTLLRDFLPRFGIDVTLVDQTDTRAFENAIRPNTKLIMLESPSNPVMKLTDLRAVAAIARKHGVPTIADNTFATAINQRPIELGVDLVFHSATKYLGGHSDLVAGCVMGNQDRIGQVRKTVNHYGGSLDPHTGFLLARGVKTLALRIRAQNENAMALATFLSAHPAVTAVNYPGLASHPDHEYAAGLLSGFGGMLSFRLAGGADAADALLDAVRLPSVAPSLGGVESLITRPVTTSHAGMQAADRERLGITGDLIRLSCGIEGASDLIADFDQALAKVGP